MLQLESEKKDFIAGRKSNYTEDEIEAEVNILDGRIANLDTNLESSLQAIEDYGNEIQIFQNRRGDWDLGMGESFTPGPKQEMDLRKLKSTWDKVLSSIQDDDLLTPQNQDDIKQWIQDLADNPDDSDKFNDKIRKVQTIQNNIRTARASQQAEEGRKKLIEEQKQKAIDLAAHKGSIPDLDPSQAGYIQSITKFPGIDQNVFRNEEEIASGVDPEELPYKANNPQYQGGVDKAFNLRAEYIETRQSLVQQVEDEKIAGEETIEHIEMYEALLDLYKSGDLTENDSDTL
jgi:hypothetical protein